MLDEGISSLRRLTSHKREHGCRRLLQATLDSEKFVRYIQENHFKNEWQWEKLLSIVDFSSFNEKLTGQEYRVIPRVPHADPFWQSLGQIHPIEAGKPQIWLSVTLQAIQSGIIQAHYLAATKNGLDGRQEIERALSIHKENQGRHNPLWLNVSRRILRSAFGFIWERGRKAIFTDSPFAVLWWKIYLTKQISKRTGISENKVANWMFGKPSEYAELTMRMTGKLTVIADRNILGGLFLFLLKECNHKINGEEFKLLLKHIGIVTSWRALGLMEPNENNKIIAACYDEMFVQS